MWQILEDRDPVRTSVLTVGWLVLPVGVWQLLVPPGYATFTHFPVNVQIIVLSIFAVQIMAEIAGGGMSRLWAARLAFIAALAASVLLGIGDPMAAAWIRWAAVSVVEVVTVARLTHRHRAIEELSSRGGGGGL